MNSLEQQISTLVTTTGTAGLTSSSLQSPLEGKVVVTPLSLLAEGQISDALELALETKNMGMYIYTLYSMLYYIHIITVYTHIVDWSVLSQLAYIHIPCAFNTTLLLLLYVIALYI